MGKNTGSDEGFASNHSWPKTENQEISTCTTQTIGQHAIKKNSVTPYLHVKVFFIKSAFSGLS